MIRSPCSSTITLIVLVVVTSLTALYMKGLNSGIPYYYDSIGYSATIGGTFVAAFVLASTVMRLVGGQITDHFPHFRVMLVSLVAMLVGVLVPAIFNDFAVVMVSRVLQGGSFAVATNVTTVIVMESSTRKHIGRRLGINGAGTSFGTMFGALVSTALLDSLDYRWFYIFYALIVLVTIAAVLWLKRRDEKMDSGFSGNGSEESEEGRLEKSAAGSTGKIDDAPASLKGASKAAQDKAYAAMAPTGKRSALRTAFQDFIAPFLIPEAMPFMLISFARRIPKGFCVAFILIFARYASIEMGAAFFVAAGATTLVCRLLGGKVFDSSHTWLLLPLQSVQLIGFVIFAACHTFPTLIVAGIGYGVSVGTTSPLVKALMAKSTPKEHWGAVNGELFFFADIGKALSAFCGGLIIDATAKSLIPEIALCFAVLSCVITAAALLIGHFVWKRTGTKV